MSQTHKLIIVGSGPAGLTAGIYAARANLSPLIIEGKSPGGQLMGTNYVENWPGEKSILGPTLMFNMKEHAQSLGAQFIAQEVVKGDFTRSPFTLWTHNEQELKSHALIIATGTEPKKLNIPGEKEYWGKGVTTCAVCDGFFYRDKEVVIIGGGDTAMEDAAFLSKFTSTITIIHILDKLTASHAMQQKVLNNPKIKIIYTSTITEIHGDGKQITQVTVENQKTKEKRPLAAQGVFVAIGLTPMTHIFAGQLALNSYGYLKIVDHTKTSVEGIFAAGDVADDRYKQAITSAGTGCMAALDAERYLSHLVI